MKLIIGNPLNINERVTQTLNEIMVMRNPNDENSIAIKSLHIKLQEIDEE